MNILVYIQFLWENTWRLHFNTAGSFKITAIFLQAGQVDEMEGAIILSWLNSSDNEFRKFYDHGMHHFIWQFQAIIFWYLNVWKWL